MIIRLRMFLGRILMKLLPLQAFPNVNTSALRMMGHFIGKGVVFYSSTEIIGLVKVKIGDNSFVGHNSLLMGGDSLIEIGDNCDISSGVSLITGTHQIGDSSRRAGTGFSKDIFIGNGVWVGYGVTILGGTKIGAGSIIAAGSLVNRNVPENTIYGGVPAKLIKHITE